MTFSRRLLLSGATLGSRLRQLRQETQRSAADAAKEINIAEKYITAIEDGRYADLPGQVYARSFVRQYVEFLGLQADSAMARFELEYAIVTKTSQPPRPLPPILANTEHHWLRRYVRQFTAGLAVLLVLIYVGWQVWRIFSPPRLLVIEPSDDISTVASRITVIGQTEPKTTVTINNQTVAVSEAGQFTEAVDISPGLNTLRIAAKKKHSGLRVIVRQVLVENQAE